MLRLAPDAGGLVEAARIIRAGGLVAFPTETFYGLAADPFNEEALARLFFAKQRSLQKAVLLLVNDRWQLTDLVNQIPDVYEGLIEKFWPGPLTLIFPARPHLPTLLTARSGTVGVRMSSQPLAGKLLEASGSPLTATSANLSGQPSLSSADQVMGQLAGRIDAVLDGGDTPGAGSSTIVRLVAGKLSVVRQGVLPFADIRAAVGL
ncbi:MAG: L-threonylcarbamoyladenylate synthase [Deltaproteobacteria bacterium]